MLKSKKVLTTIAQFAPAVGVIVFVIGAIQFYSSRQPKNSETAISPMIIERKLAIEEAIRKGEKTYSYTTRFTPGIGVISDPEAYQQEWENKIKESQN